MPALRGFHSGTDSLETTVYCPGGNWQGWPQRKLQSITVTSPAPPATPEPAPSASASGSLVQDISHASRYWCSMDMHKQYSTPCLQDQPEIRHLCKKSVYVLSTLSCIWRMNAQCSQSYDPLLVFLQIKPTFLKSQISRMSHGWRRWFR